MNRHDPDAVPSYILAPREISDEEYERIARRWRWAIKSQGTALRILNEDGSKGAWFGRRPPWWKRAYYRVRGWLA